MELPIGNDRGTEKSDERGERKKQLSPRTLSNAPPSLFEEAEKSLGTRK